MLEIIGTAAAVGVPVVGFIVWLVRLEGRQNVSDAKHEAMEKRLDTVERNIDQRLGQIEDKIDRLLDRILTK